MDFSKTQSKNLIALAGLIAIALNHFKIGIASEELVALFGAFAVGYKIVSSWINRYRKGDLTIAGFRKA